ncbi:hypothetical protein [Mobiluncus mulieris]|uniref:Antitoxin n=1 Tax=Mobiluncus mulieris TaxID=2052 RepID=A0A7Y0UV02_9ACTO|nr:hypothetical protein [Mobiluncus mulieris]NMX04235.1 hypothetical protein [Mobiluncus mulieris]
MSITVELPPDLAEKVSQLASARGVDFSDLAASFIREGIVSAQSTPVHPPFRVVKDPNTGWSSLSLGRVVTSAEVKTFLAQDEDDELPD